MRRYRGSETDVIERESRISDSGGKLEPFANAWYTICCGATPVVATHTARP